MYTMRMTIDATHTATATVIGQTRGFTNRSAPYASLVKRVNEW